MMPGIVFITYMLECLVLMPVSYTLLQFAIPPYLAILISGLLGGVALLVCWINKFSLKSYLYKIISVVVSGLLALAAARLSIGAAVIFLMCLFIFMRIRISAAQYNGSSQTAVIGLIVNVPLALVNIILLNKEFVQYSNAAIFISTIAAVILLIINQVDDSRRFAQSSMGVGTTQKKNNRIFGGAMIVILLTLGSIGGISNIYHMVFNLFAKFFALLAYLFRMKETGEPPPMENQPMPGIPEEAAEPSLLAVIIEAILYAAAILIFAAALGFILYALAKFMVKVFRRLMDWFKNKEQVSLQYFENGYIDEKQKLYDKNIKKLADKIGNAARGLFRRDVPYDKLPDGRAKVRRLFRIFIGNVKKEGLSVEKSSTAEEICGKASRNSPESEPFNHLMAQCYHAARYGGIHPEQEDLEKLERSLLK